MKDRRVPTLALLLHEAGFSWSVADEFCGAIDSLGLDGARSDDLATALLLWRRDAVTKRLARIRVRCKELLEGRDKHVQQFEDLKSEIHPEQLTIEQYVEQLARGSGRSSPAEPSD